MAEEKTTKATVNRGKGGNAAGGAYFLAFVGALVYYLQAADSFWMGLLGVLKAIVWPAFLAYGLLDFLKL